LEDAGFEVDFRDFQLCQAEDPFDLEAFLRFLEDPAPVIGLSCMANLLPFSILAMKALRERYPDRVLVLGGVGAKAVEGPILERFPWIDVICRGEGERSGVALLHALRSGADLAGVPGISFRRRRASTGAAGLPSEVIHNPDAARIADLDGIPFPAFHKVDLKRYAGYGMITSRGCPYRCAFCSVAPVWNHQSHSRGPANIVAEMRMLHEKAGVELFLFQDEFFVSTKRQVMEFCGELNRSGLKVQWKAFGRVNLTDAEMMRAMAQGGCIELRFGIESGSDAILKRVKKGFSAAESLEKVPMALEYFPRVDCFFVWGFPFETMDDFRQSLFQMVSFRMLGARILPSLLSFLPQTAVYREYADKASFEFCQYLLPEFVFTGHEICHGGEIEMPLRHRAFFDLIRAHQDIFPGFYHWDLDGNVLPKLELLRQFGFYPEARGALVSIPDPLSKEGKDGYEPLPAGALGAAVSPGTEAGLGLA
jgi:radical SAM superfamily enzyme YgiQ (UPF0313 family)